MTRQARSRRGRRTDADSGGTGREETCATKEGRDFSTFARWRECSDFAKIPPLYLRRGQLPHAPARVSGKGSIAPLWHRGAPGRRRRERPGGGGGGANPRRRALGGEGAGA